MPTGVRILVDPAKWRGIGLTGDTAVTPSNDFSDASPPWRPRPGENYLDNRPTSNVTVVNASDYTSSRELYTIFNIIDKVSFQTPHVYVKFEADTYYMAICRNYGTQTTPSYTGYNNGNKKILGWIGAPPNPSTGEPTTIFTVSPTMVEDSPSTTNPSTGAVTTARQWALSGNASFTALYLSGNGASAPIFVTGISFDGQLQSPFGPITSPGSGVLRRNISADTPMPWNGISMWRAPAGSRFQYSRSRGFAFALNSAPPFECGFINTNYCRLVTFAFELDGRIPAWADPSRPRASGGWMWNKELDVTMSRVWMHHTRRSGMATNTNTYSTSESYKLTRFQATNIADILASDPYPSDASAVPGGFNGCNVEVVVGLFEVKDSYVNSVHSTLNWAMPYSNGTTPYTLTPGVTKIRMWAIKTDDSIYDGCIRIATGKQPNSTGISPVWQGLTDDFAGFCATYFDIKGDAGQALAPVKASQWVSGTHTRDNSYVLRTF